MAQVFTCCTFIGHIRARNLSKPSGRRVQDADWNASTEQGSENEKGIEFCAPTSTKFMPITFPVLRMARYHGEQSGRHMHG